VAGEVTVARNNGTQVCERCSLADSAPTRLKGLLGRDRLEHGEGMLLRPAPAIHTCFMRFPIDAVFLDRELQVIGVTPGLRPWRWARQAGARAVLELGAGEADRLGVRPGERLRVSPVSANDGAEARG